MNKIIILSTFFLMSCANTQYKRHSFATVKYTVREYYLPQLGINEQLKPKRAIISHIRPVKKKTSRLNCERVFKEINQCMQK